MRPLPELTPTNEWFWTSGKDGQLRIQGCRDCGALVHPPVPAAHLWLRTSLRPADVDLALVYGGFTFNVVSWIEALGFCGFGEAQDWIDGGRRIALDGDLPVNPHGGQLSEGRTHGFGFLYEAVTQLRHEAGERQVPDVGTVVVTSGGQAPALALLLRRYGVVPVEVWRQPKVPDRGFDLPGRRRLARCVRI